MLTRRAFVRMLGAAGPALVLAACGAGAPAAPATGSAVPASSAAASGASAQPPASASVSAAGSSVAPASAVPGTYKPTPMSPAVKVKVGSYGFVTEIGIFSAIDNGYFSSEGLDVELLPTTGSTDVVGPITTNQLQFVSPSPDPGLFNASARDITVKIVGFEAITNETSQQAGFMVRQDLLDSGRYKEPKDLKGFNIGQAGTPGGQSDVLLERWTAKGGLTRNDVTRTPLPFPQMPAAMANKAVDAVMTIEPFITVMEGQGVAKLVMPSGQLFPGLPGGILVMSPGFAKDQPEAAKRFLAAFLRGQRDFWHAFVKKDTPPDEMFKIIANHTPFKQPRQVGRATTYTVNPNGEMPLNALSDEVDAYVRFGSVKQKPDLSQIVDPSFAKAAVELIGKV